jgi:pyruvate ferredoxin oxidoreductase alpha subunit/phenylglyoxylate dehydrogenase alpha subunit
VSFGWNSGPLHQDVLGTLAMLPQRIPAVSFIGGLAGADLTVGHFARALEATAQALAGAQPLAPVWLNEGDR